MRTAAIATTTLVAALALGVCQGQAASGTAAPAAPCSMTAGEAAGPSSADNPAPITTTWGETPTSGPTENRSATPAAGRDVTRAGHADGARPAAPDGPNRSVREFGRLALTTSPAPFNVLGEPEGCN